MTLPNGAVRTTMRRPAWATPQAANRWSDSDWVRMTPRPRSRFGGPAEACRSSRISKPTASSPSARSRRHVQVSASFVRHNHAMTSVGKASNSEPLVRFGLSCPARTRTADISASGCRPLAPRNHSGTRYDFSESRIPEMGRCQWRAQAPASAPASRPEVLPELPSHVVC